MNIWWEDAERGRESVDYVPDNDIPTREELRGIDRAAKRTDIVIPPDPWAVDNSDKS